MDEFNKSKMKKKTILALCLSLLIEIIRVINTNASIYVCITTFGYQERQREREREKERERQRDREADREAETEAEKEAKTDRDRDRDRETEIINDLSRMQVCIFLLQLVCLEKLG